MALLREIRFTPRKLAARNLFAFAPIQSVTAPSAGPPVGGLYLNPPSSGGLCEGVMTMPSASPVVRCRL